MMVFLPSLCIHLNNFGSCLSRRELLANRIDLLDHMVYVDYVRLLIRAVILIRLISTTARLGLLEIELNRLERNLNIQKVVL